MRNTQNDQSNNGDDQIPLGSELDIQFTLEGIIIQNGLDEWATKKCTHDAFTYKSTDQSGENYFNIKIHFQE